MLALANKLTNSTQPIYRFVNKHSIDFDGVDDCIITDDADTVSQPTTYSMWIKSSHTAYNYGIFGHGSFNQGSFQFNNGNKPLLELGGSYYRVWTDIPAQDDGEWHHWVVYADPNDITNSKLYCDSVLQTVTSTVSSGSANAYTESLTIGADRQSGGSHFTGKIDEFAVYDRELTQAEITRMYNTYYSPNRVANGNFSQIGNEEVTNGDFSQIGSELVVNGDFATDSNWSKGTGWTISGGTANAISQGSFVNLQQSNVVQSGKIYAVTFTISNYVTGEAQPLVGGTSAVGDGTSRSGNGTYTEYIKSDGTTFYIRGRSFTGSIDNVSVKEVGQDWTFTTGWSVGDNVANFNGTNAAIQQNAGLITGKAYKITFTTDINQGGIAPVLGGSVQLSSVTSSGTHTLYGVSGANSQIYFQPTSFGGQNFQGSITNISVKEVGQHWTITNGWSIDGTKATNDGSGGQIYPTSNSWTSGVTIKFQITVSDRTTGHIRIQNPSSTIYYVNNINTNDSFEYSFTTIDANGWRIEAVSGFDGSIDNVVVQELKHDATNLMLNAGAYQSANPLITSTKSMEFDGSDDYLQVGDVGSVKSLSFWFNPDNDITASSSEEKLFGFNTTYYGIALGSQTGAFAGETLTVIPDNSNKTATTKEFDASRWYNIVIAWNETASYFDIYVDGVLSTDLNTGSAHTLVDWSNFKIGTDNSLASEFNGQITETGVWDRTLTALEVASLYNQGMPTNLLVNRNNYQSGNPTVFNTKQVDFDGTDDFLNAGNVLNLGTTDFSISMWVNSSQTTNRIMGKTQDDANRWYIRSTGNKVQFHSKSGGAVTMNLTTTETFPVDTWAHLLISADRDGTVYIYINGVRSGVTAAGSATSLDNTGDLTIGKVTFFDSYFDGKISQVGMWNKALTADEVSSLYNHGLPIDLTTDQAAYESSSNLVGYWRMGSGVNDAYPLIADQTNPNLEEKIVNGGFTTDLSGWTINNWDLSEWTSQGLHLQEAAAGQYATATQNIPLVVGKTYNYSVTLVQNGAATILLQQGSNTTILSINSSGTYTGTFVASQSGYFGFKNLTGNDADWYISNVSLTTLGGNPAIMTNQTSSDIENGSPYANIVTNGNFELNSDWSNFGSPTTSEQSTEQSHTGTYSWKIIADATQEGIFSPNNFNLTSGRTYSVSLWVYSVSGNSIKSGLNNTSVSVFTERTVTVGEWTNITYIATASSTGASYVSILSQNSLNFFVDNVTVEEVNTGLQGYWKMGDGTNDEYPVIYDQTNATLGSDVIVNGDFNGNANNWTLGNAVWQQGSGNGEVKLTKPSSGNAVIYQTGLSFQEGDVLRYKYKVIDFTGDSFIRIDGYSGANPLNTNTTFQASQGDVDVYIKTDRAGTGVFLYIIGGSTGDTVVLDDVSVQIVQGNPATMTNMVEGNITNQYPLTKIRNYYRMGDGILDGYPIIQDQTSPNLAHIPTTNLILYSENFSLITFINSTITINSGVAPDGTTTANLWLANATTNAKELDEPYAVISGKSYTESWFVKYKTQQFIQLVTTSATFGSKYANFDLVNGTKGDSNYKHCSIESYPNGWFRLIATDDASNTGTGRLGGLRMVASSTAPRGGNITTSGTESISTWGHQVEQQSQATAYIKSDGIAAVRKSSTTNLVPYSEDFTQWTRGGGQQYVTSNYGISPDGTQNADRILFTNSDQSVVFDDVTTSGVTSGSVYVKGTSGETIRFGINSSESNFTLDGNWQRLEKTRTSSGGVRLSINTYSSATARDILVWGGQLEEQTQAETYAKTTGLPVKIDLFTENNYGTMTNMSSSDIIEDTPNN